MTGPFDSITLERNRQDRLVEKGVLPFTLADDACSLHYAMTVLCEELGEVAQEVQKYPLNPDALREELVQVAACCVALIERVDRYKREGKGFAL